MSLADSFEQYRRMFRQSHVENQQTLLGVHLLIYVIVNIFWVILNLSHVPRRYRWLMLYPIIGWGGLIFVHWWFYVRNADRLCKLREEMAIRMVR
ncbi:MAG: 2TM domain-containing protein [Methanotrichaceae archaeon]